MTKQKIIRNIPFFSSLPPAEIAHLAETSSTREHTAGSVIIREGDWGDRFYIVLRGQIDILKSMDTAEERLLATRGMGDYVGEMSLFEPDGVRTASVRARTDVELLEIARAEFDRLLYREPGLAYELVRELSKRLSEAHEASMHDLREKNRELTRAYEELKAAQAQLVEKERLEKELAVAREIQQSILPHELPHIQGVDLCARVLPSRAVGGDLFDLIDLGGGRLGVAIADVSDKGVPAAIFMSLTRSLLRAEAARSPSPVDVLQNVNNVLLDMNEAGMFVTVLYGVIDSSSRQFNYVRAGHELPLIVSASGTILPLLCGKGQPLGLFSNPALDEQLVHLELPGTIVLSTDGVTDQVDELGTFFGEERLRDEVLRNLSKPAPVICQNLLDAVSTFRAGAPQVDDITFVVVSLRRDLPSRFDAPTLIATQ